tara:strand:+ start:665 stop:1345 length:681 start_codon:yes stop_codon:yes gene_type:complete
MYDVFFIDVKEPNAEKNYELCKQKAPHVHRISGVQGIHQAHQQASEIALTEMMYVVDADAMLVPEFEFDYKVDKYNLDVVHVWHSRNPVNDLEYGYGGVKLFPTLLTRHMDLTTIDMSTSISDKFKVIPSVSNVAEFNIDEYSAWRSGFRECAKLSAKVIDRQVDAETEERLNTWCTKGADRPFGQYAIAGAKAGRQFGELNKNTDKMNLINNYKWLEDKFKNDFA